MEKMLIEAKKCDVVFFSQGFAKEKRLNILPVDLTRKWSHTDATIEMGLSDICVQAYTLGICNTIEGWID